jgi:putative phosphoribosyl transferase
LDTVSSWSPFADRAEAGLALAEELAKRHFGDPLVLALPRGGVPVAAEIAGKLRADMDIVLVRKIGVPFQIELAAAAVVDGAKPKIVVNEEVAKNAGLSRSKIGRLARSALEEIKRRRAVYLEGQPPVPLEGRDLVLVDDGVATGASMRAAIAALKQNSPRSLTVAIPVGPRETIDVLRSDADDVICLAMPDPFYAISMHYRDFHQLSDAEVVSLLRLARRSMTVA